MLAAYYLNRPLPNLYPDSAQYLGQAAGLLQGHVFNTERLPGYPALLALLGANRGVYGPLIAVQAVMYLAVVGLTYWMTARIFGRPWIAFLAGLMIASDIFAAAFSRAILSETLALLLLTSMAAALLGFHQNPRPRLLWLTAGLAVAAALTRPEWTYFPAALAVYLGLLSLRRGLIPGLLRHGLAALAACYLVIGGYVAGNLAVNGFAGTTEVTNVSLLGKVMTYQMQLEAPPRYQSTALLVDAYARAGRSAWDVVDEHPEFRRDHYELAGSFGRAVILEDPLTFLGNSLEVALVRTADYNPQFAPISPAGTFGAGLTLLEQATKLRYQLYFLAPALSILWLVAPLARRSPSSLDGLGLVALIAVYGTAITALGGFDEFGRYHSVFLPEIAILVWGTLALNLELAWPRRRWIGPRLPASSSSSWWRPSSCHARVRSDGGF